MAEVDTKTEQQGAAPTIDPNKGAAPTAEELAAARALLEKNGAHVIAHSDFANIKGGAAKEAEARAASLQAELEAIKAQAKKNAERLREIDDAGKSQQQIWAERQAEWQRQMAQKEAEAEEQRRVAAENARLYREARLEERLGNILVGANDREDAILIAKHRMPGELSANDSGQMVYTDPAGVTHTGEAAESRVLSWWKEDKQDHLRVTTTAAGPPTSGGKAGTGGAADTEPFNLSEIEHLPLSEQLRIAQERMNIERGQS